LLDSKTILIADNSIYAALDLSQAIEDFDGCVAGPVDSLTEALAIVDSGTIAGAVVDCELPDAAALVLRLTERGVPLVVQTSIPLPPELERLDGRLSVLMRPIDARTVIASLVEEFAKPPRPQLGATGTAAIPE
jgi:hypothetical protein